jgi:hypothetical protein
MVSANIGVVARWKNKKRKTSNEVRKGHGKSYEAEESNT